MYSQLLLSALDVREPTEVEDTTLAALARVLRCRDRLSGQMKGQGESGDNYGVVANLLAYDVALIDLARLLGIECDAQEFDRPERARGRLESALLARGVALEMPEEPADARDIMD